MRHARNPHRSRTIPKAYPTRKKRWGGNPGTYNVFGFRKDERLRLNASCRVLNFVRHCPTMNSFKITPKSSNPEKARRSLVCVNIKGLTKDFHFFRKFRWGRNPGTYITTFKTAGISGTSKTSKNVKQLRHPRKI